MRTHPIPAIRTATLADQQTVSDLLAEAFLHGDLADWLIPHLDTRARIYPHYFALHVEHALTHGQVEMTTDAAAVVIWYYIDAGPLPELPDYSQRLADITGRFHHRFTTLEQTMHDHHPYDQPHHYLASSLYIPTSNGTVSAATCSNTTTPGSTPPEQRLTSKPPDHETDASTPGTATGHSRRSLSRVDHRCIRCDAHQDRERATVTGIDAAVLPATFPVPQEEG